MESGETSTSQRRNNEELEKTFETPLLPPNKKTNKGTKFDEIWQYFIQGEEINKGHYRASCYYCQKNWSRGQPGVLKAHLANDCTSCPEEISNYWRDKLSENKITYTRNSQKPPTQPLQKQLKITQHFGSDKPLPFQVNSRIDRSLLKAWVIAGIPFEVIENPFIVDLIKDLNPGYIPPSRSTLSGRLLDEEVARINKNINSELENIENLTLSKLINIIYSIFYIYIYIN